MRWTAGIVLLGVIMPADPYKTDLVQIVGHFPCGGSEQSWYRIDLEPSDNLVGERSMVNVFEKGQLARSIPISGHQMYRGTVSVGNKEMGWARAYIDRGQNGSMVLDGTITIGHQLFNIRQGEHDSMPKLEPVVSSELSGRGLTNVTRSGLGMQSHRCGSKTRAMDGSRFKMQTTERSSIWGLKNTQRHGDYDLPDLLEDSAGCPATTKVLYMGVAVDCSYTESLSNNVSEVEKSILQLWNILSGIFESTFNIQLGVVAINVMVECSESDSDTPWNARCSRSYSIADRLNDFSRWRGTIDSDAGLWHLLSGCTSGETVGMAWLNQLCNTQCFQPFGTDDYVSGTGVTVKTDNTYVVVAHELGHNFGAGHDCTSLDVCDEVCILDPDACPCCSCGNDCDCKNQFIMNPESGVFMPSQFSPCSVRDICLKNPYLGKCLEDPGSRAVILRNVCGNGIKEEGEECDCGDEEKCMTSLCCNPDCTLKNDAECSDENDICCSNCKFKDSSTVCLPSGDPCKMESYCTGSEGACPKQEILADGEECVTLGDIQGTCASGICTNRDLQCRILGSRNSIVGECKEMFPQCSMFCMTSEGQCMHMDAVFIDGTPCFGGYCYNGSCRVGNVFKRIYKNSGKWNWLAIVLAIGVCLLIYMFIRQIYILL